MPIPCPYPGLRAFFTAERDWYFGREAHVDAMLTCLESSRVLAVVGSSGSGKSSLVYAGLLPALREGQLAGSRRDAQGQAAPWRFVDFKPGNDPLENLATAIVAASPRTGDPHLAGYVRAALRGGEGGLVAALAAAGLLDETSEILVYADQFEELFRFGEKSGRAAQEDALRFARLFVAAATQSEVRLHLLLSMRSEFIGECERFPGLPELVSRSQFLTPRLSRRQLEFSLRGPAEAVGWTLTPDAQAAILNDCADRPDHLPLAQHILRRMWCRAESAGRTELTLEDYAACGGIRGSVAQHGEQVLAGLLGVSVPELTRILTALRDETAGLLAPEPPGLRTTRCLFMALCDQREEGPLVRRLSTREEVQAIAGHDAALVEKIVTAFGGDDPGFVRDEAGSLDVRHEVVLRQWPLIAAWREREAEAVLWLRDLAQSARDLEKDPEDTSLWPAKELRGAEEWMLREQPTRAWAVRHGVRAWRRALRFLALSRRAERREHEEKARREREAAATAAAARDAKERRRKSLLTLSGALAMFFLMVGMAVTYLWREAELSKEKAVVNETKALEAGVKRVQLIRTVVENAKDLVGSAQAGVDEATRQAGVLTAAIVEAKEKAPPEESQLEQFRRARVQARQTVEALGKLAATAHEAAGETDDEHIAADAAQLTGQAEDLISELKELHQNPSVLAAANAAAQARLDKIDAGLAAATAAGSGAKEREAAVDAATADFNAVTAIHRAAFAFDFTKENVSQFLPRYDPILAELGRLREAHTAGSASPRLPQRTTADAFALRHGGKVNRVRFAAVNVDGAPLLAAACEDKHVYFWRPNGAEPLAKRATSSAVLDVDFNPAADAVALASAGSSVRIARWAGPLDRVQIQVGAFEQHRDTVTDVEFSHGGERIASASADRTVRVFEAKSPLKQLYYTSPPLPGIVTAVQFHPKDNIVLSSCDDGGVRLHDVQPPAVQLLGKFGAPARRAEFDHTGAWVVAASGDGNARVWIIERAREGRRSPTYKHDAPLTHATFQPIAAGNRKLFVTTATNGRVTAWRLTADGDKGAPLEPTHPGAAVFAQWSQDGRRLATVGGGEVLVWEWKAETDEIVARLRLAELSKETSRAEFSPDGKLLVAYGGDDLAYVWDLSQLPPAAP